MRMLFAICFLLAFAFFAPASQFSSSNCDRENLDISDIQEFLEGILSSSYSTKSHRTIAELLLKRLNHTISNDVEIYKSLMIICDSHKSIVAVANFYTNRPRYKNVIFLDYLVAIPPGTSLPASGIYQGGAGRAAIYELVNLAAVLGKLGVATEPAPSAIGFYSALGFKKIRASAKNEEHYLFSIRPIESVREKRSKYLQKRHDRPRI